MTPSDATARYFSETGQPLLTAAEAAVLCGVQQRTIYQWVRRKRLAVLGLDEDGLQLYDAADVARLMPAA